jgi:poly-gamma-glutamate synthesis protein (capsule biosynthesis protein)
MTGRGIDQILTRPADPVLYEPFVRDARDYVKLAEQANGPFPHPVDPAYIWGVAPEVWRRAEIDLRIINLETSVTASEDAWPDKGINYRMHPGNVGCLSAVRIDCCALANNHVLDWGYAGLDETLLSLDAAGIARAGAGRDAGEAGSPAILEVPNRGRVLVFSFGTRSSGIPREWAASEQRPGVQLLKDLSEETAESAASRMRAYKLPGDVLLASIHWGPNWGYEIPDAHVRFAHRLVEGGVDVVHGHSSHHVLASELYQDRLILYGCGDFLDDYEGISGYEEFRPELRLAYLIQCDPRQGRLSAATLVPLRMRRFRLEHASQGDADWLHELLDTLCARFGTRVEREPDRGFRLRRA